MFKRLYPYMKPSMTLFYLAVFFLLLDLVANLVIPWITGRIIDTVFQNDTASWELRFSRLYQELLFLILSFMVLALAIYLRDLMLEWFSQKTIHRLRFALFAHMQKLDMVFFHQNTVGELMSRVTSDIEQLRNYCCHGLRGIVFNLIFYPVAVCYMLYLNWQLTLLCLLIGPVIALLAIRFTRIAKRRQRYNRKSYDKLSSIAQESLNGIRIIQNFMRHGHENSRFCNQNHKLTLGRQHALANFATYSPILEVLGSFSNILALTTGAYMAATGYFSLGTWVQFISYTWMIVMPMRQMGDLINMINMAQVSAERLWAILDQDLRIRSPETAAYIPSISQTDEDTDSITNSAERLSSTQYPQGRGELEFINVAWSGGTARLSTEEPNLAQNPYDKYRAVLRNINLKVPAGTSLGIIGETGSGKTTLANLICRFADPDTGQILMDGINLPRWDLSALRAQISYVMQDPFLFSETLAFNIGFNEASVSQDQIIRSAQRSAAHNFINVLEQGYQTVIGERGVGLSGGQRQRTALARALVKESPILILDDTTSAVDMETEKEIQQQLQDSDSHPTRIIIAHRLSSVMHCDQIIVMKAGQIVERGNHQELMAQDSYYSQIFRKQLILEKESHRI